MRGLFMEPNMAQTMQAKIDAQPWLQAVYKKMIEVSEEFMGLQSDYLDNYVGTTARKIGGKVGALYTSWLLTGEERYLDKAKDLFMWAVEGKDLAFYYGINNHLSTGDAGLALSLSYNFLYDHLSEQQRKAAEGLITEIATWLHTTDCTWGLPQKAVTSCNHNCVHYGALGLCGIVLDNEEWLAHGLDRVKAFLANCKDETGYITEGLSYLNFGMMTGILFSESYKQKTGIQILDLPDTYNQVIAHLLPTPGTVLKLSDHGLSVENMLPQVYLMNRYKNPAGMYLVNQYEEAIGEYFTDHFMDMSGGFVYPMIYLFADETMDLKTPTECDTPLTQVFESGRIMTRSKWDDPMATHLSITCGYNFHKGHNHPDQGSFTAYGLGEEFLIDIGAKSNDTRSHNIMMVNGIGQPMGRSKGEILKFEETKDYLYTICDTTRSYIYTPQTYIGLARRMFMIIKEEVPVMIIRDDIQLENPKPVKAEQLFEFMMHTVKGNEMVAGDKELEIIGQNHKNTCKLRFVTPEVVDVMISDENREVISYRKKQYSADLANEAVASCNSYNPFMTTVVTFAEAGKTHPEITTSGDKNDLTITVGSGEKASTVHISRYEMKFLK